MSAKILLTLTLLFSESTIVWASNIGKDVYERHCIKCHAPSNIMVASPKFGDKVEWQARLAADKDLQALVKSAMKGKNAMPKKGLCLECKEKEIESAILYMIHGE